MVTVIQMKAIPRKKSIALVKNMNTSVKADVMKESKKAYKGGYDPSLMNDDLLVMRDETQRLRHDVVVEGKKLFLVTSVITIFAENEKRPANSKRPVLCNMWRLYYNAFISYRSAGTGFEYSLSDINQ